jgi:hypothetical protein
VREQEREHEWDRKGTIEIKIEIDLENQRARDRVCVCVFVYDGAVCESERYREEIAREKEDSWITSRWPLNKSRWSTKQSTQKLGSDSQEEHCSLVPSMLLPSAMQLSLLHM